MSISEPLLCKDCRWAHGSCCPPQITRWYDWVCMHPSSLLPAPRSRAIFLISGDDEAPMQMSCEWARGDGDDRCGPQGRFWEEKDG